MDLVEDKVIYCFSGLAADEKLFQNLVVPGYHMKYIHWLRPEKEESLPSYALRLSAQIEDEHPILLGVSFGGMLAIEAAKHLAAKHVIIISSVQAAKDLPLVYKIGKARPMLSVIPDYLITRPNRLIQFLFGVENKEDKALINFYLEHADPHYIRWALWCILNWKVKTLPPHIEHIHGNKDRVIPLPASADYIIKDGGHMMVRNKATEISRIIFEILNN